MKPEFPDFGTGISVDTSKWPLLILNHSGSYQEEQTELFLKTFNDFVMNNTERYALVADLSHRTNSSSNERRLMSRSMSKNKKLNIKYRVCTAMVFDSAVMRGALQAITWINKPPYPTKAFKNLEEAIAWAEKQF